MENLIKPIYENNCFNNPWKTWKKFQYKGLFKWKFGLFQEEDIIKKNNIKVDKKFFLSKNPTKDELEKILPVEYCNTNVLNSPKNDAIQVTWIGHSSALIQLEEINFLTDPIWSERCSPISWMGPKRIRPLPIELNKLPKIDFVLISHNHYDHLDLETVKKIGNETTWFVPLGLKKWFEESARITNVKELNWWESINFQNKCTIIFTPAQHWSKRTLWDDFMTLWGSWCVLGKNKKFFFAGDTGYCEVFSTIGLNYGPFDLSLIPIGAYSPREFMCPQHIDPNQAIQIHLDIKSKYSLGIHWGTFILTDEPIGEPPILLEYEMKKRNIETKFITTNIGKTLIIP